MPPPPPGAGLTLCAAVELGPALFGPGPIGPTVCICPPPKMWKTVPGGYAWV